MKTFYHPLNTVIINAAINHLNGGGLGVRIIDENNCVLSLKDSLSVRSLKDIYGGEIIQSNCGLDSVYELPVSLADITLKDFKRLANRNALTQAMHHFSIVNDLTNLKVKQSESNPNIYYGIYTYYWLDSVVRTPAEQKFADMLKGFDFYYENSDDGKVFRRGELAWLRIRSAGLDLGLDNVTMFRIYNECAGK